MTDAEWEALEESYRLASETLAWSLEATKEAAKLLEEVDVAVGELVAAKRRAEKALDKYRQVADLAEKFMVLHARVKP